MNTKVISIIALGVAGALCGANIYYLNKTKKITDSIEKISKDIDVELPEKIVNSAIDKAVQNETRSFARHVLTNADNTMYQMIEDEISKVHDNLKDRVEEQIKHQVSMLDIEDIKAKVSRDICSTIKSSGYVDYLDDNNTADIIRACKEAGITSSYDIKRILEVSK